MHTDEEGDGHEVQGVKGTWAPIPPHGIPECQAAQVIEADGLGGERPIWRYDIWLLDLAAKAVCSRCSVGFPLLWGDLHEARPGVKVFCSADGINRMMRLRMQIPLFPEPANRS